MEQKRSGSQEKSHRVDEEIAKTMKTEVPIITEPVSSIAPISTAIRLEQQVAISTMESKEQQVPIGTTASLEQAPTATVTRLEEQTSGATKERLDQQAPIAFAATLQRAPIVTETTLKQQASCVTVDILQQQTPVITAERLPPVVTITTLEQVPINTATFEQKAPTAIMTRLEQKSSITTTKILGQQGPLATIEILEQLAPFSSVTQLEQRAQTNTATILEQQASCVTADKLKQQALTADEIKQQVPIGIITTLKQVPISTATLEKQAPTASATRSEQQASISTTERLELQVPIATTERLKQQTPYTTATTLEQQVPSTTVIISEQQAPIGTATRLKQQAPIDTPTLEQQVMVASTEKLKQQSSKSIPVRTESNMATIKAAPLILIHRPSLIIAKESTIMPRPFRIFSNLPSPKSLIIPSENTPESLFFLALAKVNNSALSLPLQVECIQSRLQSTIRRPEGSDTSKDLPELSPPDSVISAPPSYTFVLRQIARRRPRLMGTFIPSPSFILHTPPPNYGAAFDVYIDNRVQQPPPRIYNFGFVPMPAVCHECGHGGLTVIRSRITICTHLSAIFLCLFCCWLCVPLPYILRSCKDVYHYCSNCRTFLGIYCPTNPPTVQ